MKRTRASLLLFSIFSILYSCPAAGQTAYNLDIIWQRAGVDTVEDFGMSLSGGDINGDGYNDIIVGCPAWNRYSANPYKGTVKIFTDIIDTTVDVILTGENATNLYGFNMCSGDFNADGFDDVAVGALAYGANYEDGKVYVYYGGNTMDTAVDWSVTRKNTREMFGCSVSSGDINGDGIDDLVVGALGSSVNNWLDGRVYVYYGDTLGLHTWPDVVLNGGINDSQEEFGTEVVSGMDLNGDGFDDIAIGAKDNSESYYLAGKIYVYFGGNPMDTLPDIWFHGEIPNYSIGWYPLGWCGSRQNGYISFSSPDYPGGYGSGNYQGKVYLLKGGPGMDSIPDITKVGADTFTWLGKMTRCLGRLSDDSLSELGIVLGNASAVMEGEGQCEIWLGKETMTTDSTGYMQGRWSTDYLLNMAAAGDVDKDGKDEVLFSNPQGYSQKTVWLCKYTGPDGVAGQPVNNEQLAINNVLQNSPNPFSHQTTIKYQVSQSGKVSLKVYNIAGQVVRVLANEDKKVGSYEVRWNGCDDDGQRVSNGIYIYQLKTGGESMVKKMTLLR
jgi:hypothetical protein